MIANISRGDAEVQVVELMDAFAALEGDVATAHRHSSASAQHAAALNALRSELSTTNLRFAPFE